MPETAGSHWESVSNGILTVATVLAAATAAGFFALATRFTGGQANCEVGLWVIVFAMMGMSLTAYAAALVSGLQVPFREGYKEKMDAVKSSAKCVGAQGILAVYAIIGLTVMVFLDNSWLCLNLTN